MIELYLSSDGKHTVHVTADTPEQLTALVPVAKVLYREVLTEFGTKAQLWEEANHPQSNGHTPLEKRIDTVAQALDAVAPRCPTHQAAMAYRQGRYGPFWSCRMKEPDGKWCTATQEVVKAKNGQSAVA
ncbi:MAG: hypothetical protein EXR62_07695 [Chloroflexi bacterium]|nr:hypothetical protein [Chloroflexota bacterium]